MSQLCPLDSGRCADHLQDDAGAGLGVGTGVVMLERNPEMPAYRRQIGGPQVPGTACPACTVHRKGSTGGSSPACRQQACSTPRSKALLWRGEGIALRRESLSMWASICRMSERRPHGPGDAVDMGIPEASTRWANQGVPAIDNPLPLDATGPPRGRKSGPSSAVSKSIATKGTSGLPSRRACSFFIGP